MRTSKERVSRILHLIVLGTFFLPFFYTGCGPSAEEKTAKHKADSIAAIKSAITQQDQLDSAVDKSTIELSTTTNLTNESNPNSIKTVSKQLIDKHNDKLLCDKLVERYPSLSLILRPAEDKYSGLGTVVNGFPYLIIFSLTVSFLLLLFVLIIKIIDSNSIKTIVMLELFSLIGVIISRSPTFTSEKLWGFWICIVAISSLLIYDSLRLIKNKL